MSLSTRQKVVIVAGPNGAGKTTFAREFLPNEAECPVFVNADLIAAGLSPFKPELAAIRAGRLMLQELDRHFHDGRSFAFETTLSGLSYLRRIEQWRAAGCHVKLVYLALATPEQAIERVRARVSQGGHDIPDPTVRRRFAAGLENFHRAYRDRVDFWQLFDNSGSSPTLVAEGGHP